MPASATVKIAFGVVGAWSASTAVDHETSGHLREDTRSLVPSTDDTDTKPLTKSPLQFSVLFMGKAFYNIKVPRIIITKFNKEFIYVLHNNFQYFSVFLACIIFIRSMNSIIFFSFLEQTETISVKKLFT